MTKKVGSEIKSKTDELLEKILASQTTIVERLEKVENVINKPITSQTPSLREMPELKPEEPKMTNVLPVPQDYRTLVNTVLNKNFDIELEPHTDAPVVTATIVVPDKYSTMTPAQKEIMGRDIRPKVMTTAGGANELREWVETVYRSFTPELQSMIVMDRTSI